MGIVLYYYMNGNLNKKQFDNYEALTNFIKSNLMIQIDLILKDDKRVDYKLNIDIEYMEVK